MKKLMTITFSIMLLSTVRGYAAETTVDMAAQLNPATATAGVEAKAEPKADMSDVKVEVNTDGKATTTEAIPAAPAAGASATSSTFIEKEAPTKIK